MSQPVSETKISMSDPTALGVFGLALVCLVASSQKLGLTGGEGAGKVTFLLPWTVFLGSLAQIWASSIDFKKGNYFGAVALGTYGLFWMAMAFNWAISLEWLGPIQLGTDPRQVGVAFIGYLVFSIFIMIAAMEANKCFFAILALINVLFFSLAMASFGVNPTLFSNIAAWTELFISLLGFYACGANFLNNFFGRTVLSLGKPMGWIRKGA
ncbi:MAG: acetate uptake transporter [Cystobacterineae bacterium]|nr:acetate uptake transporter [Cystobacterineae bacterium]